MDTQALVDEEITKLRLAGCSTRDIASELNERKLFGPKGGQWTQTTILRRLPHLSLSTSSPGVFFAKLGKEIPARGATIEALFNGRKLRALVLDLNDQKMCLRVLDPKGVDL